MVNNGDKSKVEFPRSEMAMSAYESKHQECVSYEMHRDRPDKFKNLNYINFKCHFWYYMSWLIFY